MGYTWYDFLGNVGVFLLLTAYLLLQLNKINSNQISYSLMNAIGAALIIVSLIFEFNLSAFAIEFFWLLISLVGIVNYYRTKTKPTAQQDSD